MPQTKTTSLLEIFEAPGADQRTLQDLDRDSLDTAANEKYVDLSSRLWEMGNPDEEITKLRKDITLHNAPAALWSAVNEDDDAKLNELRLFGADITQGYLAQASEPDQTELRNSIETNLKEGRKALEVAKENLEATKQTGGEIEFQGAQKKVDELTEKVKTIEESAAGLLAEEHEGECRNTKTDSLFRLQN